MNEDLNKAYFRVICTKCEVEDEFLVERWPLSIADIDMLFVRNGWSAIGDKRICEGCTDELEKE